MWTIINQETFEEIMARLLKPPLLHLLGHKGKFQLFSDISKTAVG